MISDVKLPCNFLLYHCSHHAWVSSIGFAEAYNAAVCQHNIWKGSTDRGNDPSLRLRGDVLLIATTTSKGKHAIAYNAQYTKINK